MGKGISEYETKAEGKQERKMEIKRQKEKTLKQRTSWKNKEKKE